MRIPASLAVTRFGLGARPGEIESVGSDPVGWLADHVRRPQPDAASGVSSADALTQFGAWLELKKAAKSGGEGTALEQKNPAMLIFQSEVQAWTSALATTNKPFFERLALFWQNHFCVAVNKASVRLLSGPYVREAIRPHIGGRFADMLKAAAQHPAMLDYLDNANSIGPNSKAGRNQKKGLNENLAREVLELHTLGSGGGYTPADVTSFANLLTGWSFVRKLDRPDIGAFAFRANAHEPGSITILDRTWPQTGLDEGLEFLEFLGTHPQTARLVATKLARHFVSDTPSDSLVAAIEAAFIKTSGELPACYEALLAHPDAWTPAPGKFRTPQSFLIAALRALAPQIEPKRAARALAVLGQPVWRAPSPKGWPDLAEVWIASDAMKTRLDLAATLAANAAAPGSDDPPALAKSVLGDRLTDETATALARAADNKQALTLLLMSPEFQRS
jgi:uncharacterized protein (DUF1800 family)